MPEAHDALLEGRKVAFDTLAGLFFEAGTVVEFLKANATNDDYDVVDSLASSWWLKYDNFRKQFLLQIVEGEWFMASTMETATHVRIDDDIYVIAAGDVTPPKGTDVTWKIYCEKWTKRGQFIPLY